MTLERAIQLARMSLVGKQISTLEANEAYNVLAKYHDIMGKIERAFIQKPDDKPFWPRLKD